MASSRPPRYASICQPGPRPPWKGMSPKSAGRRYGRLESENPRRVLWPGPGREGVAEVELGHPGVIAPDSGPGPVEADAAITHRAGAGHAGLEGPAQEIHSQAGGVRAAQQVLAGGEQGVVQHHAVPARAVHSEREVRPAMPLGLVGRVGPLTANATPQGETVGVEQCHAQVGPAGAEARLEQLGEDPGGEILVAALHHAITGADRDGAVARPSPP